jgi:hypothetical protein
MPPSLPVHANLAGSKLLAFIRINPFSVITYQDEDGGKARKKQKMDKKDKQRKDGSSRRDKRGAAADDDEAAGDEEAAGDAAADGDYRAEELFGEEEENEDAALETDADRAFIDDDGTCQLCQQPYSCTASNPCRSIATNCIIMSATGCNTIQTCASRCGSCHLRVLLLRSAPPHAAATSAVNYLCLGPVAASFQRHAFYSPCPPPLPLSHPLNTA